jgi:class 3 adenylate cyclase
MPTGIADAGSRRMLQRPEVSSTTKANEERWPAAVVFTDIVESTRRAAALGDTHWLSLRQAHYAILRRAVRRYAGHLVTDTGDGVVATFTSPVKAVRCALEIAADARALGVEIRAGIHLGECRRRGKLLGGIVFHVGARVLALASPGEVLVSSAVKAGTADAGFEFVERGSHELKGLPGEWPVFAVVAR